MDWKAKQRNFDLERRRLNHLHREEADNHPLESSFQKVSTVHTKPDVFSESKSFSLNKSIDAGSNQSKLVFDDPLSRFAAEATQVEEKLNESRRSSAGVLVNDLAQSGSPSIIKDGTSAKDEDDGFESWSQRQSKILLTFTTSQKLSLVALSNKREVATKALPTSVSEKVKTRLEQLDELEEGFEHETLTLTQEEYVNHINKLGGSLVEAWKEDQRVKTLKIAIQCSKLLSDTSSKQFYPSKFVIITEILNSFGHLVFERLLEKALSSSPPSQRHILPVSDLDPELISDTAKETCHNWFYKVASIRELLPRVYIEASLLRCFDFLERGAAEHALERLVGAVRGIADPLSAVYLRCYLARVGDSLATARTSNKLSARRKSSLLSSHSNSDPFRILTSSSYPGFYLLKSLSDTITGLNAIPFCREMTSDGKLRFFVPAVDWVLRCLSRCVATQASGFDALDRVFAMANQCKDHGVKSLFIGCLISQSPHSYVAEKATEVRAAIAMIEADDEDISDLYSRLGRSLSGGSDPPESARRPLLNDVWTAITSFERPRDYSNCAAVWSAFVGRHFSKKEVNVVMGDAVKKLTPDRAFEAEQGSLRTIMGNFMNCAKLPLVELVVLSNFLPFLDIMEGEAKTSTCKDILKKYSDRVRESRSVKRSSEVVTTDPVVVHTFMSLCKYLHDQVSAITVDEEVFMIGRIINDFVGTVSKESESSQLEFYVECRSSFCNIDPVLVRLVHKVNELALRRRSGGMKGQPKREGGFLRACSAYSFITIPSLNGVFHRLNLYHISGQVALQNGCVAQADTFFRSIVRLIAEVPRFLEMDGKAMHTEGMLLEFIRKFCSSLIVLPDPPDQPPLFHFKEILSAINAYRWDPRYDSKPLSYCSLLLSLSTVSQSSFPYRIQGIDSNDALYGSDPKFLAEVSKLAVEIMTEIVRHLETLDRSRVVTTATMIFSQLIAHLEPFSCAQFFRRLWNFIGSGSRKEDSDEISFSQNTFGNSVSINITKVVERIKSLAATDPSYRNFMTLMI